jgi:aminoglycoside phosphotransferase
VIIKDIINKLHDTFEIVKDHFEVAISYELNNIKNLINDDKIKKDDFIKSSNGLSPEEALTEIENNILYHNNLTLSHGDLCLPNILVTHAGDWSLIDFGKGGISDHCRDLSSLEGNMKRNIDNSAFPELCKIMNIKLTTDFQKKIDFYKLIDLFWHNAIL